jgi:PIN domain nuclease of toxin-antitoxin system
VKYLLDTHTLLWFLEDSDRLSNTAADIIEDPRTHKSVSVASMWEFTIKHSLGKLRFDGGVAALWNICRANGFGVTPIAQSHLETLAGLPAEHRDPFDRLLIAATLAEGMTLVTSDASIQRYPLRWAW